MHNPQNPANLESEGLEISKKGNLKSFYQRVYIVLLELYNKKIKPGRLPLFNFNGRYIYIGSANGKAGFKRVKRHIELSEGKRKNKRWHIDYLLTEGKIKFIILIEKKEKEKLECKLAKIFSKEFEIEVKKFGSTDCKCKSHLFKIS
ncbi:MAG: GIY-YIG nuclease family protein [candidate division WOR-3 bacterium]